MVAFSDIEAARRRSGDASKVTPCQFAAKISEVRGAQVRLKMENLQHTGSFKARGAINRLLTLDDDTKRRGVIAASAGNHAQGLAYHAQRLSIPATIVMPTGTPLMKVTRTQEYGATAVLEGSNYDDAFAHAEVLAEQTGAFLVHGYNDPAIIAGQGTCGLELIEQYPYVEVVVIPVGGGGLISGMALALKKAKPTIRIIGVELGGQPSMKAAIDGGAPVTLAPVRTVADGIAVRRVGENNLAICQEYVDEWVCVDDDDISRGILYLLEREKTVSEGAGAAAVAALVADKIDDVAGREVACVVSGGNIDVNVLSRIIERGLVESGRKTSLIVRIPDTPGSLAAMLQAVADAGGNVVEVHHERLFSGGTLGEVTVKLVLETKGHAHAETLISTLRERGFTLREAPPEGPLAVIR